MLKGPNINEGYVRFRDAMLDGTVRAGMVVTQNQLCDLLSLSLSPLRETLVLLEDCGLVEVKPRSGIHIVYPDVAFIRENFQFRIMIETNAMQTFIDNVSDEWLKDMRARHERNRERLTKAKGTSDTDIGIMAQLDRDFHSAIVGVLGNKTISKNHSRITENITMARMVHKKPMFRLQLLDTITEHLEILDGLEARDVDATLKGLNMHFRSATHRIFAT